VPRAKRFQSNFRRTPTESSREAAMTEHVLTTSDHAATIAHSALANVARDLVICLIAFLTVVDLFATQALLPTLVVSYGVSPAAMGTAVNASTLGMAMAGLFVAYFSHRIDRRGGIVASLALLAVPTALLAAAPDLATFTILRIVQGLLMATAFTLTLAFFAETTSGRATTAAFAAYITGNVASNLFGRLLSTSIAETAGVAANFYVFAALNLAGAALVFFALGRMSHMAVAMAGGSPLAIWRQHLGNRALRAAFAVGFCILFAFVGTFTYVNFVLVRPPISLGMMSVGLVYFVFLPAMATTPLAGRLAGHVGARVALWSALAIAGAGLPLLLHGTLQAVIIGLMLVGIGTFLAQATVTGFVGRAGARDPGSASGIYLACYFLGGLVGSAVLGQVFVRYGWPACVFGIGAALGVAAVLARRLVEPIGSR
jgi:MFS transporter, YNFM family, putative membrane transport protein